MLKRFGFSVDLLLLCRDYFWYHSAGEREFAAVRELVDSFHFVPGDYLTRDDDCDWGVDDWMSPSFEAYVKWLSSKRNYDVVFCNYVFLSQTLTYFPASVCRILETHDKFGGRRDLLLQNRSRVEFFYTSEQGEAIGVGRSDLVIAIKDQEAAYFRKIAASPVITLPYVEGGQNIGPKSWQGADQRPPRFGYFASSNWINRENLGKFIDCYRNSRWFRDGMRLSLEIYGSLCDVMEPNEDVYTLRGRVREVREVYNSVDCIIIPQEFSTGLKIKVSEALSFGVPIIAHVHALEGFPVEPDALTSCRSFEEMVKRCFTVQADPKLLETLRQESRVTQELLLEQAAKAEIAINRVIEERLSTVCIVAAANLLAKNTMYFDALQCIVSAFSGVARTSLCAYGDPEVTIHDYEFKGGLHINEFWNASESSELEKWMDRHRNWSTLILTPDVELAERVHRDGFGRPSQILFFRDFCAYAALTSTDTKLMEPSNCIIVSGRPTAMPDGVPLWHLRWLPWSLSFHGALVNHTISDRGFLLTRTSAAANIHLREHLELVSLNPSDDRAMSLLEFVQMLLSSRVRPRFVVDETNCAPQCRLLLEMLYLNGIPIFSASPDDEHFLYGGGMADWRISLLVGSGVGDLVPKPAPGWRQSGWDVVRRSVQRSLAAQQG